MNIPCPVSLMLGISIGGLFTSIQDQRASVASHIVKSSAAAVAEDQSQLVGFLPNVVNNAPVQQDAPVMQLLPVPDYTQGGP